MKPYEQHLRDAAVPRKFIDEFLDASKPYWARFDPEVGYVLGNSLQHDGMDGCWTISTVQSSGARTSSRRIASGIRSSPPCSGASSGRTASERRSGT